MKPLPGFGNYTVMPDPGLDTSRPTNLGGPAGAMQNSPGAMQNSPSFQMIRNMPQAQVGLLGQLTSPSAIDTIRGLLNQPYPSGPAAPPNLGRFGQQAWNLAGPTQPPQPRFPQTGNGGTVPNVPFDPQGVVPGTPLGATPTGPSYIPPPGTRPGVLPGGPITSTYPELPAPALGPWADQNHQFISNNIYDFPQLWGQGPYGGGSWDDATAGIG